MHIPEHWGIHMDDNRQAFCEALASAVSSRTGPQPFRYVEIGVAKGGTLAAMCEAMDAYPDLHWTAMGLDIPAKDRTGYFREKATKQTVGAWLSGIYPDLESIKPLERRGWAAIVLRPSFEVLPTLEPPLDFLFIDGCHGYNCVRRDFELAEPLLRVGSVVAFHDTNPRAQGWHQQAHCQTGIEVRRFLMDVGLLDNSRPGFVKTHETGERARMGGAVVVQKIHG